MKKVFAILFIALSIPAFSVNITFKVSMKGSGMDLSNGVFIVGSINEWAFEALTDEGDSLYSITKDLNAGDTLVYYFITNNTWDNYESYREPLIPDECDGDELIGWAGDRAFIVPAVATTRANIWGSCSEPGTPTSTRRALSVDSQLTIYPNPASSYLRISLVSEAENLSAEIFSIAGQLIKTIHLQSSVKEVMIDVSGLYKGIYLLRLNADNLHRYQKFAIN